MPSTIRATAAGAGRRRFARLAAVAIGLGLGALLAGGDVARAQDDAGTGDDVGTEVRGTLKTTGDDGEEILIEGVQLEVSDADGNVVGVAVSDADGNWSLALPGEGEYTTLLLVDSLPEGISLREGAKNPVSYSINPGDSRPNLFPIGEATAKGDNTIKALQLAVDGLKLGLIIAMCAIGLSLIYGTTGLVNFAHGEAVTFGALAAYLFHVSGALGFTTPLIVAAIFAVILAGFAGGAFNQFVWKPMRDRGASLISALVVSIGFSIFLRYVMLYIFGGRDGFYKDFRIQDQIDFGWFTQTPRDVTIMAISLVMLISVASALQFTRLGKAMRAVADNRDLAASSGIDVEKIIRWVWVAGTALAGLGGVLWASTEAVGWEMGFRILLLMFAGVTLGGLGTAYGALFGSLIVGVFIQMSTLFVPSDLKNVGALLMLVVILLVRPQGLLGRAERIG